MRIAPLAEKLIDAVARSEVAPERLRALAGALALAALMSFAGLGSSSLWGPDEPRVASIGRAMFESGELVAAKLNGELFLQQPPLYYWTQALAFRLFGISDAGRR